MTPPVGFKNEALTPRTADPEDCVSGTPQRRLLDVRYTIGYSRSAMTTKYKPNEAAIRKIAGRHGIPRAVLETVWPPRDETIVVEDIEARAAGAGYAVDRLALVHFLKDLGKLDYGRFVTGRRGHKSRFEWAIAVIQRAEEPAVEAATEGEEASDGAICHSFMLRRDVRVDVELPADMTLSEAKRLATFITSLPFGDEKEL